MDGTSSRTAVAAAYVAGNLAVAYARNSSSLRMRSRSSELLPPR